MSVQTWKRTPSHIQYIQNARELLTHTIKRCLKFPKRLTFFITTKIAMETQNLYELANQIYNFGNNKEKRKELCKEALSKIEYLGIMYDMLLIESKTTLTDKQWEDWLNELTNEYALIQGIQYNLGLS